jgi:hypothetical protein
MNQPNLPTTTTTTTTTTTNNNNNPANTDQPSPQHINEGTDLSQIHSNCSDHAISPQHTNHYIDNSHHRQQKAINTQSTTYGVNYRKLNDTIPNPNKAIINYDNHIDISRDISTSHAIYNDNSIHTHPINHYTRSVNVDNFKDNTYTIKTTNIDMGHNGQNHQDRGALYNNHIAKHLNINYTSCRTSTANNYSDN